MTMTCDQARELFVEALYADLAPALEREFTGHIAACATCAPEFDELKGTLAIMNRRRPVEPGHSFQETLWSGISANLDMKEKPSAALVTPFRPRAMRPGAVPAWAYGIAATILLAVGIYVGRTYFGNPERISVQSANPPVATAETLAEDSVTAQAVSYLERSKNVLIGLANLDVEHRASLDLRHNQEVSRELIEQASTLTVSLNRPSQQQIRQLIMDLEVILLQLANIEVKPGVPAIEMVQKGIDQKSILLKINLEEMRAIARRSPTEQKKKTTL